MAKKNYKTSLKVSQLADRRTECNAQCSLLLGDANKTRKSPTAEIARVGGHYAVQVYSRSSTSVQIKNP